MRQSHSAQLNQRGNVHFSRGFYTEAYQCYAKALEADRQSGDPRALVATLGNLGNICAVSGKRQQAQEYYQEVLELQKTLGDNRGISATLANLGNLHVDAGEWERGRAYYLEALDRMELFEDDAAKAVLLSRSRRESLERLIGRIEHVELETTPDFFEVFVEGCQFKPMPRETADLKVG